MTAVDHDGREQVALLQHLLGSFDVFGVVVRFFPAAQDDMHFRIAGGLDDGGEALTVDAEEGVGMQRCDHGVDRDLQVAVGAVFEADREGEAAGQLPMSL